MADCPPDSKLVRALAAQHRARLLDGRPASIEAVLDKHPACASATLASWLVFVEMATRIQQGEEPTVEEYLFRFPGYAKEIAQVFVKKRAELEKIRQARNLKPSLATDAATEAAVALLGRFELRELLSDQEHCVVYRAYDPQRACEVALRIVRCVTQTPENQQLLKAVRAADTLQHPHIAAPRELGWLDETLFLVSDFVNGQSLQALLAERQRLAPRKAASLVGKLAKALDHAHSLGISHGRLKLANVLVDAAGEPWIVDFGWSQIVLAAAARCDDAATKQRDQGALGEILYELLSGQPPFPAGRAANDEAAGDAAPALLGSLVKRLPRELEQICACCLASSSTAHYTSCAELAEALARYLNHDPVVLRGSSVLHGSRRRPKRSLAVTMGIWSGAVLLSASAVGLAGHTAYAIVKKAQGPDNLQQETLQLTEAANRGLVDVQLQPTHAKAER